MNVYLADGSLFATILTDANGTFSVNLPSKPNTAMYAVDSSGTRVDFTTGSDGSARINVPLPTSTTTTSTVLTGGLVKGTAAGNSWVAILAADGVTVLANVTTDAFGNFAAAIPYLPNTQLFYSAGPPAPAGKFPFSTDSMSQAGLLINPATSTTSGTLMTTTTRVPSQGVVAGTAGKNSFVEIRFINGTMVARVPTDSYGFFSAPIPYLPSTQMIAQTPDGTSMPFSTDGNGNGAVTIPPATTTRSTTTATPAFGTVTGTAASNSWVAIRRPDGTIVANVSTDAFGAFSARIPYNPNTGFTYEAGGSAPAGKLPFTTDASGNASLLIPPATSTTQTSSTIGMPAFGVVAGTAAPNSWVVVVANVSTNASGFFSSQIPYSPNTSFTYEAGGGAPSGKFPFATDANGNASLLIPPATSTTRRSTTNSATVTPANGLIFGTASPNSFVAILAPDGTLLKNVSTDASGQFSATIPYLPNTGLTYQAGGGAPAGRFPFTTDGSGMASLLIPPATSTSSITQTRTTTTPVFGVITGASAPNSFVEVWFPNGTLLANVTTNSFGSFSGQIPYLPNTPLSYSAGGSAAAGKVPFSTDGASNAGLVIPPATSTVTVTRTSTRTATVQLGLISGTAAPNSFVAIFFPNGTLLAKVSTDSSGHFTAVIPFMPSTSLSAVAGAPAPAGPFSFTTDALGNGQITIPPATTTLTFTATTTTTSRPAFGIVAGTSAPNSFVAIFFPNGTLLANVSTDSTGTFSAQIPYLPNQPLSYQAGGGAPAGTFPFTLDGSGNGFLLIPPATSTVTRTQTSSTTSATATPSNAVISGTAGPNSWVSILGPDGSVLANVSTDATGHFSAIVPFLPSTTLSAVAGAPASAGQFSFTTDSFGNGQLTIPPATTTKSRTTATTTPLFGVISGTSAPNSFVAIFGPDGTLLANVSTDASGAFSATISFLPNSQLTYQAGAPAPQGNFSFSTNGSGSAVLVIPPATTTRATTTALPAFGSVTGTAAPNSWVAILDASGSVVANVSTDASGTFSSQIPYSPNTAFTYQAGGGAPSGSFTTDSNCGASLTIPPATSTLTSTLTATRTSSLTATTSSESATSSSQTTSTTTPLVGLIAGTSAPNSWVAVYFPNGTLLFNTTTDASGAFSVPTAWMPNQPMSFTAGAPAPAGTFPFSTDGSSNAGLLIPPATSTQSATQTSSTTSTSATQTPSTTSWTETTSSYTQTTSTPGFGVLSGTSAANSFVEISFANGTLVANVSTDASGSFSIAVPAWPNQPMFARGGPGTPAVDVPFATTDSWGYGSVLIPPATSTVTATATTFTTSETQTSSSETTTSQSQTSSTSTSETQTTSSETVSWD